MRPFAWAVLIAIAIAVVGVVLGVAGIFVFPIVGAIAVVALVLFMLERKAEDKPPIE